MWCAVELSDVHHVVLVLQYRRFIVVHIEIIRRTEYRHDAREARRPRLSVHAVPCILGFVGSDDGQEVVFLEEGACGRIREEVRTSAHVIMNEELRRLLLPKLFQRIGPEDVAHQAVCWWFAKAINLNMVSTALALRTERPLRF